LTTGNQKFAKGGQITISAGGVDNALGVFLSQNALLSISPGGKGIGVSIN
jgi:hypothetical protein